MTLDEILQNIDHSGGWDACWPWTRAARRYGLVRYEGKFQLVHRLVWTLAEGPIPEGMQVLHSCDTPRCCNWTRHLFLGSHQQNMADMVGKSRSSAREIHPHARLSEEQVAAIRRVQPYHGIYSELGRVYGISKEHARRVYLGERWRERELSTEDGHGGH